MKNAKLFWRLSGFVLMAALFFGSGNTPLRAQDEYILVKGGSTLKDGDAVLIVGKGGYAMNANGATSSGKRGAVSVVVSGETITAPTIATSNSKGSACVFFLSKDASGKFAFHDTVNDNNYLTSTTSNASPSASTAFYFTVTVTSEGVASIIQGSNDRYMRCYNSQDFRLYANTTNGDDVYIYKKKEVPTGPFVSGRDEVNYSLKPGKSLSQTLSFTAGNLTDDLSVSVASATEGQDAVISVSPNTVSKEQTSFDLTLTASPLAEGTYADNITLKMGETTLATVKVNLTVAEKYKITTLAELEGSSEVLIVHEASATEAKCAGAYESNKYSEVSAPIEDGKIPFAEGMTTFTFTKEGSTWKMHDNTQNLYITYNSSNNFKTGGTDTWTITEEGTDGRFKIASTATSTRAIIYGETGKFAPYATSNATTTGYGGYVHLYEKYIKPTCDPVSNVQTNVTATGVTLSWTAPAAAPAEGYKVSIRQGETAVVTDAPVAAGTTTYTCNDLTAGTEYTYSIVSACSNTLSSEAVTGTFSTPAAGAKTLNVALSGDQDAAGSYTGNIKFEFTAEGFTIGTDGKVKYRFKDKDGSWEGDEHVDDGTGVSVSFNHSGKYTGLFKLVDMDGNALNPAVEKTVDFTVDLPDVNKPVFSPEPASTFFTSAQTVTLSCATEGATIYYSVDGGAFAEYTAGIELNQTDTVVIKAFAQKAYMDNSDTVPNTYRIRLPETVVDLKAVYGKTKDDYNVLKVSGEMVVTHKDDYNKRVWVQDIDKDNGASMLLFKVPDVDYAALQMGDVLENVVGTLAIYNDLYELTPTEKVEAKEHNHTLYVDTLTAAYINANIAMVQNALVCVENVTCDSTGNFKKNTQYVLKQGADRLNFYTTFNNADYVLNTDGTNTEASSIPTGRLNIVGILSVNTGSAKQGTYITARNKADMVAAPCLVPTNITAEAHSDAAEISWTGLVNDYQIRYAKEESALESATPEDADGSHHGIEGLEANTQYHFQMRSVCGEGETSDWSAVQTFTTLAANAPSVRMTSPVENPTFTDTVLVSFTVRNVTLKESDTSARIKFSDGFTHVTADTAYKRALPSGSYTVQVELIKNGAPLDPAVQTQVRGFNVDLPDVAAPVFTPAAGRYEDSVEVTLSCATEGASIFCARGEGGFEAYTAGEKIVLKETAVLRAFACKDRMDTSAVVSATYTVTESVAVEGEVVFGEPFDKVKAGTAQITDKMDENTQIPGWTAVSVYQHTGGGVVRVGVAKTSGSLETPAIDLSADNGKYMVSFYAQAWKGDKNSIRVVSGNDTVVVKDLVNDKETNNTAVADLSKYVAAFENGTADTKIKFEAVDAASNRFFLDDIRIYQVLPDVPTLTVAAALSLSTVQGTPVSREVTVKGKLLSDDVTVTCPDGNFSVSPATLAKADVMGEGAKLSVTFNGNKAADTVEITLASGELSKTLTVTATATQITEVENIAALRAGEQNTLYKIKGEVVLTAMDTYRNYKWIEDATGAILIDDNTGLVTGSYAVGDGITGVYGKLGQFGGQLQLVMVGDLPEAGTHTNKVEPVVMTVAGLKEKIEEYCSRLVRIEGLSLTEAAGVWEANVDNWAVDAEGDSINIRTFVRNGSFIGEEKPEGKFDLVALAGVYNGAVQVSPRVKEDIVPDENGGGNGNDDCQAPTGLKATVADNSVSLSWNGETAIYRVTVLLGKDTVCNETVATRTHSLKALQAGTYSWAVASVCDNDDEKWTKGEDFVVKSVANEASEGLECRIYPNPTAGVFYVEVAENVRMEIFTLGGVVLRSEELTAGRNEVRLDASGIYFVRLNGASGAAVKRVIVR